MQTEYCLVLNTCPDENTAQELAKYLLQQRLAACVNILPKATSVYAWQGEIHTDAEVILLIKTQADRYAALEQALEIQHPYEVPEIIALPIQQGSVPYLDWIKQHTLIH